jgi:type II secretion system protein G
MKKSRMSGFTLIELVIVIAILGILAGIAIPRFLDASATARGARILADMKTMDDALELYYLKTGTYPAIVANANGTVSGAEKLTTNNEADKCYKLLDKVPVPVTGTVIFPCKPDTKITLADNAIYVVYNSGHGLLNEDLPSGICALTGGGISEATAADLAAGGKGW